MKKKRSTARIQAGRIEWILAQARLNGGTLTFAAAANGLGVSEATVRRDLGVLVEQEYYRTAASGYNERISLARTRLRIENPRPRSVPGEVPWGLDPLDPADAKLVASSGAKDLVLPAREEDKIRAVLEEAIGDQRPVWVELLKAGESESDVRLFNPLQIFEAGGFTYLAASDPDDYRVPWKTPRLDRIVGVRIAEGHFQFPSYFKLSYVVDPEGRLAMRKPEVTPESDHIVIRYGVDIARWIEERRPGGTWDDECRYTVAFEAIGEGWAVEEVLQHAPHAELLEPASLRARIRQIALDVAQGKA